MKPPRIGIYAGTFDPVHDGHISFARATLTAAHLDHVYFLPEKHPRYKPEASSYLSRRETLSRSIAPYPHCSVLELPDTQLSVTQTLRELTHIFPTSRIVFLFGADVVEHLLLWPDIQQLVASCEFVIGMRDGYDQATLQQKLTVLGVIPEHVSFVTTKQSHLSSSLLRGTV